VTIDETSTVTIDMENAGLVDATDLVFRAPLPAGLALASFAIDGVDGDIDGNPVDGQGLVDGVAIGDVAAGATRQIVMQVTSTAAPADGTAYVIEPQWEYAYVSCAGEDALIEPHSTEPVTIDFEEPPSGTTSGDTTGGDGVDESAGDGGDASATAAEGDADASATAADDFGDADAGDSTSFGADTDGSGASSDDGCGCRADRPAPTAASLFLLALLGLGRRRRG
jgi:uncharacterized repeat protein (TIGR01451 family)/MYXO-CTERM domain-containing protein